MYSRGLVSLPKRNFKCSTEDSFVLETTKTKLISFGNSAFSSYVCRIWNSLQKRFRDIDKIESCKKQLKHHLFLKALCEEQPFKQNYLCLILINVGDLHIHFIFVQSIFIICPKLFKVQVSF